jgi:hypothetical protein
MNEAARPTVARRPAFALAAILVAAGAGAWLWVTRAPSGPDAEGRAQASEAARRTSERARALMRQGQRFTKVGPPRFRSSGDLAMAKPRPFSKFVDERPALAYAFNEKLKRTREADWEGLNICAFEFMQRHPYHKAHGFSGKVAFQITMSGGKARVEAMKGIEGNDPEFVDCFAGASSWANGEIEADSPDGTDVLEWPYSFGPLEPEPVASAR